MLRQRFTIYKCFLGFAVFAKAGSVYVRVYRAEGKFLLEGSFIYNVSAKSGEL